MATIDSNGILFYEETDAVSPLHTLLNGGQTSVTNAITALGGPGSWTSYTPTLSAATINPNLGTAGSVAGAYKLIGKTCHWRVTFTANGTGIYTGSGWLLTNLPVTPAVTTLYGIGDIYGTAGEHMLFVSRYGTTGTAVRFMMTANGGVLDASYGLSSAGHFLTLSGSYEAA